MKEIQNYKGAFVARSWKPALVLLFLVFSMQLWGAKESGWDMDLGMALYESSYVVIQANSRVQSTISLGSLRLGGEIRFPAYYSLIEGDEFLSVGAMIGPRLSIKSAIVELGVTGTYGPQAMLRLTDKADLDVKLTGSVDYIIKLWADDDLAFYFNYNRTYKLAKDSFGSLLFGVSILTDY